MKPGTKNSYNSLTDLRIDGNNFKIYSLPKAELNGLDGISNLPKSLKVLNKFIICRKFPQKFTYESP